MKRALAAIILLASASSLASAQSTTASVSRPAQAERTDPRIRVVNYSPNRIISLRGHLGYQMLIEFDPSERIENVAIGDSVAWQVTPNRAATMLFLKPVVADVSTNMTVVTTLRRYSFDLRALQPTGPTDPAIIYTVRFNYPQAPMAVAPVRAAPKASAPRPVNTKYTVRGSDRFDGVRIFDDGVVTYFQIPTDVETPAIFVLDHRGEEELVNAQTRPPYVVVDQLARGFLLRSGRHKARVQNEGYGRMRAPSPATEGPTP